MSKNPIYYYNKEGQCFIYEKTEDQNCQLHGEFIQTNVWGCLIKTSGKPSNVLYATSTDQLHQDSRNYLKHLKLI